jgi:soluble lytic murein transglycosylase-like protein
MFDSIISKYSSMYDVPEYLIRAVISTESSWNPDAYNSKDPSGAYGLMQVLYSTAKSLGYTGVATGLLDPDTNINYGTMVLQDIISRIGLDNPERIYSAYNSGNPDLYLTSPQVAEHVNRFLSYLGQLLIQNPVQSVGAGSSLVLIIGLIWLLYRSHRPPK